MTARALIFLFTICQITLAVLSEPLLKVPKVYNALITSDQNLAPSRSYPVIQPVVHRTAIGYSPPFYYPGAPAYAGDYVPSYEANYEPSLQNSGPAQSAEPNPETESMESEKQVEKEAGEEDRCKTSKPSKGQVPLSFYPNFKSTYYDPYFYGFNVYPAFPTPGNYYFNYQPQGFVPSDPQSGPGFQGQPGYQGPQGYPFPGNPQAPKEQPKEESEESKNDEKTEKVPDVPPPPLPARRSVKASS